MRHTSKHRNNRMRLQKIRKNLARDAKQAKKARKLQGAKPGSVSDARSKAPGAARPISAPK